MDRLALKEPLESWSDETIDRVVNAFTDEKFPTVIALNKIDHPDSDANIARIAKMQDPNTIVLCSAVSEIFLRKLAKQGYIRYTEGSEFVDTREDLIADGDPEGGGLKELDEKNKARIENLKDMVLYRFGSTGVVQVLAKAAEILGLVPVFPVRNTASFSSGAADSKQVFRDCVLVKKNSTVADVARKVMGDAPIAYIEGVGGLRVAEDDPVAVGKNDVSPSLSPSKSLICANLVPRFSLSRLAEHSTDHVNPGLTKSANTSLGRKYSLPTQAEMMCLIGRLSIVIQHMRDLQDRGCHQCEQFVQDPG